MLPRDQQPIATCMSYVLHEEQKNRHIDVMIFVWYYLSSRPEVFRKKIVLRNFSKLTGKHLC